MFDRKLIMVFGMLAVMVTSTFLLFGFILGGKDSYKLADRAKQEFNDGKIEAARKDANELLQSGSSFSLMGNGIAVHDGNMVLGRIALKEHHVDLAKEYLLKAGLTSGAPTLDSFGPNMSLAKDLIEAGERDTVIKYFEECRKFWEQHYGTLNNWEAEVKAGKMPDFGANLLY